MYYDNLENVKTLLEIGPESINKVNKKNRTALDYGNCEDLFKRNINNNQPTLIFESKYQKR